MNDEDIDKLDKIFDSKKGFYPTLSQFFNKIKDDIGNDFLKRHRKDIEIYYQSQDIVQVFSKPPYQMAFKKQTGFYPKIISFFPFERLYCDSGSITLFDMTRKEGKQLTKQDNRPIPKDVPTVEYDLNKDGSVKDIDVVVPPKSDTKIKTTDSKFVIKQYSNRGKLTAFIEIKDSSGKKYRFEKFINDDIDNNKKWIQDNILNPYLSLDNDKDRDEFLKNKKAKK